MSRAEDDTKVEAPVSEESWASRSGVQLTLRAVRTEDQAGLRAFIDGLSRESRYFRFLTGGNVADEVIRGFVSHQLGRDVALVVTSRDADTGMETIVANAEYVVNDEDIAELAVVVADGWQGQGLGRRLINRLQQLARSRRLRGMRGDVLSENHRMLAIMRGCGFTARRNPEDSYLHEVSLMLAEERRAPAPQHWMPGDWATAG